MLLFFFCSKSIKLFDFKTFLCHHRYLKYIYDEIQLFFRFLFLLQLLFELFIIFFNLEKKQQQNLTHLDYKL